MNDGPDDWNNWQSVLVYCDWLEEQGRDATALRSGQLTFHIEEEVVEHAEEFRTAGEQQSRKIVTGKSIRFILTTTIRGQSYLNFHDRIEHVHEQIQMQLGMPEYPPDWYKR